VSGARDDCDDDDDDDEATRSIETRTNPTTERLTKNSRGHFLRAQVLGDADDAEAMDVLKPKKGSHRVFWFGSGSVGHVSKRECKPWDANAFRASLEKVKRGRDALEAALADAEAYVNGGGEATNAAGVDDAVNVPEATPMEADEEEEEEAPKKPAPKKRGAGRRKKVVEDEDEEENDAEPAVEEETPAPEVEDAEEYRPDAEEEPKPSGKKRKLSKKADGEEKKAKPAAAKAAARKAQEVEKPVIKVPSSTTRLLELKTELENGLQAYEDTQAQQEKARIEYEKAKAAMTAAQTLVEQANSHANRCVRRLKQTARHIQEQSVNPVMLQETLITKTIKKGSKVKDPLLVDFAKTCGTVMEEWIELVRTSAATLVPMQPVEEVKTVVKEAASAEEIKTEDGDEEEKSAAEVQVKPNLPPVLAETFAKSSVVVPKPTAASGRVPKDPSHDPVRLRVVLYLEQEHGLSRNAALTLEAALFDQTAEPGLAYKSALKRVVEQPSVLSTHAESLDSGNVRPALLLAFRGPV